MSGARAPGAAREQAYQVAVHLLGSGNLRVIAAVVAMLIGISWLGDTLFELLTDLDAAAQGQTIENWWPLHRRIGVGFFAAELVVLWWLARDVRRRYRPRIGSDPKPAQARGLILFLSNLKPGPLDELTAKMPELTGIDAFRAGAGENNWRMPLEAIAYHLPRLQRVVAVCSAESIVQWPRFQELVRQLFRDAVLDLCELSELCPQDEDYQGGLAFDDVATVARATDDALDALLAAGLPLSDILIDITGGQKPNAVAATAVALAEGRRIQYVSGKGAAPYDVTVYDVTYER